MRERSDRDDFVYGEYAVTAVRLRDKEGDAANGDPGKELTRRMSSDMGVDFDRKDGAALLVLADGVAPLSAMG
jgi:hypothetical protein